MYDILHLTGNISCIASNILDQVTLEKVGIQCYEKNPGKEKFGELPPHFQQKKLKRKNSDSEEEEEGEGDEDQVTQAAPELAMYLNAITSNTEEDQRIQVPDSLNTDGSSSINGPGKAS